ncbi:type VI secretion system tip protein VgrG [Thalassotalea euphylliae]|uniref:Type VI secretion system tip protein VgrG n=1 Tax=Thalassotalea euphylliae TaxID=1655234 RepID=A0A3E0TPY9_9GAMM|nr:type VI secretion system tip protein TssI/VgrG [Thalassotalea euphylliae]REL26646.1 type VI secretion system tip protein VgrG [Thalassotalea euphylliae]
MNAPEFLKDVVANESQYYLNVAGLPQGLLSVTDIASVSDEMCASYEFTVDVLSSELISADTVVGKDVSLGIVWGLADRTISGLISRFIARGQSHQGYHYSLTLSSHLSLLNHKRSNRVYTAMTVDAIITNVFEKSGFPMANFNMQASGPNVDMLVQYNETDFQFVDRIMRRYGMVYGVIEQEGTPVVTVSNTSADFASQSQTIDILYQAPTGTNRANESIFAISRKSSLLTNSVSLNDYNYEQSGNLRTETTNNSAINGFGADERYGENYQDTGQGDNLAKVRQQAIDCQRDIIIIDTDCRAIRPGMLINVVDHQDYSGSYFVVKVDHLGSQAGGVNYGNKVKNLHYKNQAHLVPAKQPYVAAVPDSARVFTSFNATIEQEIDDQGRYIVKLPFNQDGEGEQSKPTRMVQPYGGSGHGMNFPLTQGTEVIVCGENGDLDRPIILGAVYNEQAVNPVTSANSHENLIVTRAGHTLLMDDKLGEEKISLASPDKLNQLKLDATNGSHAASLTSVEGKINIHAKENINVSTNKNYIVTAEQDVNLLAGEHFKLATREGDISINANQAIQAKAGAGISLEATDNNIDIAASANINVQARQDMSLYAEQGNVSLKAEQADVEISAGANLVFKSTNNGSIHISQGNGSLEIDAGGNLTVDANSITLSAANIVIKGNAVSNN